MNSPKVSVVVPIYNRPQLVLDAIKSILSQTYIDFEIVVVDDSNNAATEEIIKEISDSRIKYFHNLKQLGFAENKNEGVRRADSSALYLAFLDDDDLYLPEYLERVVAFMDRNSDCMAVCTDAEVRRSDGVFIKRDRCEQKLFWRIALGNGCMIRREIFWRFNIWWRSDILFEDLDFGIRVAKDHRYEGIPDVLRIYNAYSAPGSCIVHATAFTSQPKEKIEQFLKEHYDIYRSAGSDALAWILNITGKVLVRNGYINDGRLKLKESLRYRLKFIYFIDYCVAWLVPSLFRNSSVFAIKNKILGLFE